MTEKTRKKLIDHGATKTEMRIYELLQKTGRTVFDWHDMRAAMECSCMSCAVRTVSQHRLNMIKKGLLKETPSRFHYELVKL